MTFIIAQGLGIVATLCFLFSFQVRTNRGLYLLSDLDHLRHPHRRLLSDR